MQSYMLLSMNVCVLVSAGWVACGWELGSRAPNSHPRATHPARRVPFFQERTPNLKLFGGKPLKTMFATPLQKKLDPSRHQDPKSSNQPQTPGPGTHLAGGPQSLLDWTPQQKRSEAPVIRHDNRSSNRCHHHTRCHTQVGRASLAWLTQD